MSDRAKQFLPFAALKGDFSALSVCEYTEEPKRRLSNEELQEISYRIGFMKNGAFVQVRYYLINSYTSAEGIFNGIDSMLRTLILDKKRIPIDDIVSIYEKKIRH